MKTKRFNTKWLFIPSIVAIALILSSFIFSEEQSIKPLEEESTEETELKWYTDINQVHQISQSSGKPIFAFFTGSDWCGWCKKLQYNVFAKDAFIDWANDNVVLLELDFPRKTQLDSTTMAQNYSLQRAFGVRGYPTIWIFNTTVNDSTKQINISALGSLGYPSGAEPGKEEVKFLESANQILANGTK